jgi:hypothetical protein
MPEVFDKLKTKNISEGSLKLYMNNLKRLNDGNEIKNFNFLKNTEAILKKIEAYKENTKRTYIISIVSLLKQEPKLSKTYDYYYKLLIDLNNKLKTNTTKSETQTENWISQEQVQEIYNSLEKDILEKIEGKKKINEATYNELLHYFILSLYVCMPPRRNLDYQNMKIVKKFNEDLDKKYNYLELTTMKFYFNNYKTQKTYKCKEIDINEQLQKVIGTFLKFHPHKKELNNKFLIVNYEGNEPKSSNYITTVLNKIFHKKIGCSMLRNIYLSSKYGDAMKDMKDDVATMGTSTNVATNQYIKEDS